MSKKTYKYRGILIFPYEDGWKITDYHKKLETLVKAKNYIDKRIGGYAGKNIPARWLQDEELKQKYCEYMGIKQL